MRGRGRTHHRRPAHPRVWSDDGKKYSVATHADDLAKFISALNAGPAHVVGWSYGGWVAIIAAQNAPSRVRSLILYEGGPPSVLAPDSPEAKTAAEDRAKFTAPAMAALKAGDAMRAAGLFHCHMAAIPTLAEEMPSAQTVSAKGWSVSARALSTG
jgi:pimeloyl-ACP methyl ester carboxylesterase